MEATVDEKLHQRPNPRSKQGRAALAGMITELFKRWQLSTTDQMALLGLSEKARTTLMRYRNKEPLADNRDLLDRVGNLLAIHRSLRILFPKNNDLVYKWITLPNKAFDDKTPVQVIRENGFLGLLTVKRYLNFQRGQ
jgi:hypothetical protein